ASFIINIEGDYLLTFYATTNDSGGNVFALVSWDPGSVVTAGSAGVTGTLAPFSTPFDAGTQGTETKDTYFEGIYHFTVNQRLSIVNVGNSAAMLRSNTKVPTITTGIVFELLRAGPPSGGP